MAPERALEELAGFGEFKRIAIVGHEPDFSILVDWLLGVTAGGVEVKKGAIACLRINPPSRRCVLKFLIPPKLADE
jgi:phosphohistidine phosphatase SixA